MSATGLARIALSLVIWHSLYFDWRANGQIRAAPEGRDAIGAVIQSSLI
jgi:hypothetical protein